MTQNAWAVVGRLVKARRERLGLAQPDLQKHGGPGSATVSKIERAAQDNFPLRTQQQVEKALGWSRGTIEQVLEAVDAGDWDQLGPDWEADLVEHDVPDLTAPTDTDTAPVSRAADLSDSELLAELTYRMRQYAGHAQVPAPTVAQLVTAELGRRGKNPGWLMDQTGLEVEVLIPFLRGQRELRAGEMAKVEKALGWDSGVLAAPAGMPSTTTATASLRDRAV